ncbi:hypothetical protein U9K52_08660 [Chryseobacterium sp. MHB01]|uniref:hypothetical protein n=1 Tax=Chryseobacterium sp. MHB01 TaxID=3109433 RepID=UPI002AFED63B|nr:hypothetical protein [Chryseobacterium sp. MHB01]MEA1848978.1 hypothetical protein [Chryseobacterium sp. MHB01]
MKNPQKPKTLKEVQAEILKVKEEILPGASIPNSLLYKRANLAEAEAVLMVAKSQNRKVIRLSKTESGDFRKLLKST